VKKLDKVVGKRSLGTRSNLQEKSRRSLEKNQEHPLREVPRLTKTKKKYRLTFFDYLCRVPLFMNDTTTGTSISSYS
jgi:hypothetical protein